MNHLDLFAGIGGFSEGLKQAGFEIKNHFFSEIDKHAIAIYQHQFNEAQYVGSVTDVRGSDLPNIDIITFGSPCQDFSLAGKRKGLDGERSSLIGEAIRLITECRPDIFIWENVKGAFSSNSGADFWSIIQAFADIGGYRLEWQLLNTAWFLPQNRERIYLVGRIAEKCSGEVFPIEQDAKRTNEGAGKAPAARALTAGGNSGGMHSSMRLIKVGTWRDFEKDGKAEGFREIKNGNCPTIPARAREDRSGQPVVKIAAMRGRNPENPKSRKSGLPTEQMLEINEKGTSNTLTSVQKDNLVVSGVSMERTEQGKKLRKEYEAGDVKHGFNEHRQETLRKDGLSNCIDTNIKSQKIGNEQYIRRLTEIECERLQGFPDNWTELGDYDGEIKPVSATQRYKCLGNAVTVDVVLAIGERLIETNQ